MGSSCSIPQPDLVFGVPWDQFLPGHRVVATLGSHHPRECHLCPAGHSAAPQTHPSTSKTPNPNTSRSGGSHSPSVPLPRGFSHRGNLSEQGGVKPIPNSLRSSAAGIGGTAHPGTLPKAQPGFGPGAWSSLPAAVSSGITMEQLLNQLGQPNGHPIMARGSWGCGIPAGTGTGSRKILPFLPLEIPAGIWAGPIPPGQAEPPTLERAFRSMNFSGVRLAVNIFPAGSGQRGLTPWGGDGGGRSPVWMGLLGFRGGKSRIRSRRWVWLLVFLSGTREWQRQLGLTRNIPETSRKTPQGAPGEVKPAGKSMQRALPASPISCSELLGSEASPDPTGRSHQQDWEASGKIAFEAQPVLESGTIIAAGSKEPPVTSFPCSIGSSC